MRGRIRPGWYAALLTATLGFVVYLLYAGMFRPLYREAADMQRRAASVKQKMDLLSERAGTLARLRNEYVGVLETVERLESAVTREGGLPYFLKDLQTALSASGTTVVSVSAASLANSSPYAELPVTVSISGSYLQVNAFVSALLSQGRAMSVKTLRLAAPRGTTSATAPPVLDATLAVTLYVLPEGGKGE